MRSTTPDAIWVGVDIGTQSVRTLAVDPDGATIGAGSHPLTSRRESALRLAGESRVMVATRSATSRCTSDGSSVV